MVFGFFHTNSSTLAYSYTHSAANPNFSSSSSSFVVVSLLLLLDYSRRHPYQHIPTKGCKVKLFATPGTTTTTPITAPQSLEFIDLGSSNSLSAIAHVVSAVSRPTGRVSWLPPARPVVSSTTAATAVPATGLWLQPALPEARGLPAWLFPRLPSTPARSTTRRTSLRLSSSCPSSAGP